MAPARRLPASVSPETTWSVAAGGYLFACAIGLAVLLDDILTLFADVIGLPGAFGLVLLASPALPIGAAAWWAVVERPRIYAYRRGALAGLLTAVLTGLVWVGRFVQVWGVEMVAVEIVALLAGVVLGVAAVAGTLVGPPLLYARRRLDTRWRAHASG